jgi:hypothetical protein
VRWIHWCLMSLSWCTSMDNVILLVGRGAWFVLRRCHRYRNKPSTMNFSRGTILQRFAPTFLISFGDVIEWEYINLCSFSKHVRSTAIFFIFGGILPASLDFSWYQKISAEMQVVAYGIPVDYTDKYLRIGECKDSILWVCEGVCKDSDHGLAS